MIKAKAELCAQFEISVFTGFGDVVESRREYAKFSRDYVTYATSVFRNVLVLSGQHKGNAVCPV